MGKAGRTLDAPTRPAHQRVHPRGELRDGDGIGPFGDRLEERAQPRGDHGASRLVERLQPGREPGVPDRVPAPGELGERRGEPRGDAPWDRAWVSAHQRVEVRGMHWMERRFDAQPHQRGRARRGNVRPDAWQAVARERGLEDRVRRDHDDLAQIRAGGEHRGHLLGGRERPVRSDELKRAIAGRGEPRQPGRPEVPAWLHLRQAWGVDPYPQVLQATDHPLPERRQARDRIDHPQNGEVESPACRAPRSPGGAGPEHLVARFRSRTTGL